jgi:transmembrane sensor
MWLLAGNGEAPHRKSSRTDLLQIEGSGAMMDLNERLKEGPLKVRMLWNPDKTARLSRLVLLERRRRFMRRAGVMASVGAVACVCALAIVGIGRKTSNATPQASALTTAATGNAQNQRVVAFADGSQAELIGAEAGLRIDANRHENVIATVLGGVVRFDVVPSKQRVFEIQSGDVKVRVLGTAFSVASMQSRARISVERGMVQVLWPGGEATLRAGEAGDYPPVAAVAAAEAGPVTLDPANNGSHWRDLALKGEYDKAYGELYKSRGLKGVDAPQDLMLAADVARLSRHPAQAVAPLRKLMDRYPSDTRAPLAAFTLARILLDDLGRPNEAAEVFSKARKAWPGGPLAVDALAREVEARSRAGQMDRARELASQYLDRYPKGRHAANMRKILTVQ